MLHPAANRHPKATHQWLLMGVQACRLPALKRLKPLKHLKTLKILKTLKTTKGGRRHQGASPFYNSFRFPQLGVLHLFSMVFSWIHSPSGGYRSLHPKILPGLWSPRQPSPPAPVGQTSSRWVAIRAAAPSTCVKRVRWVSIFTFSKNITPSTSPKKWRVMGYLCFSRSLLFYTVLSSWGYLWLPRT